MDTKEKFKDFVKKNPVLLKHVNDGKKTWQQFYEMYDLYGEDNTAWKEFLTIGTATVATTTAFDFMGFLKGLDLESIQNGVSSLQRVVGVFQDMSGNGSSIKETNKKPRPLYKHFED